MRLVSVKAINFRNIKDLKNFELDNNTQDIFLIGNNGQGKTNFIEAIYYLCFGSSFRTNFNKRIIQNGKKNAFLSCSFIDNDGLKRIINIRIFKNKGKEIQIDSKMINDRKTLIENTACIVFTHDDMIFVNGSPDKKRWFINQTTSLIDYNFIDLLRNYSKILKSRNIALKKKQYDVFDLYDDKLIDYGLCIQQKRSNVLKEFNKTFNKIYSEIVGTETVIELLYKPSWDSFFKDDILKMLNKTRERDKIFGNTMLGPHRDTFEYISSGVNYTNFASTGQIRLLSIILRIAQLKFVTHITNKKHIILLDDVLLELDQEKRKGILKQLGCYEQAFFTFLPHERITDYEKHETTTFLIDNGEITRWKKQEIY